MLRKSILSRCSVVDWRNWQNFRPKLRECKKKRERSCICSSFSCRVSMILIFFRLTEVFHFVHGDSTIMNAHFEKFARSIRYIFKGSWNYLFSKVAWKSHLYLFVLLDIHSKRPIKTCPPNTFHLHLWIVLSWNSQDVWRLVNPLN